MGSTLPVRFPESLRLPECTVTPFAIQPGQVLMPESCAVALCIDGPLGSWVGVWRPDGRQVHHLAAPVGWLAGSGLWTRDGVLRLPYATDEVPCGVAELTAPAETRRAIGNGGTAGDAGPGDPDRGGTAAGETPGAASDSGTGGPSEPDPPESVVDAGPSEPVAARPVPLGKAPLGRLVTK